jgi:hypothetical protein
MGVGVWVADVDAGVNPWLYRDFNDGVLDIVSRRVNYLPKSLSKQAREN